MNMQYTFKESIDLLESRIKASKENYHEYRKLFNDAMNRHDIDMSNKYYRWKMQELYLLNELLYIYRTITGKEY